MSAAASFPEVSPGRGSVVFLVALAGATFAVAWAGIALTGSGDRAAIIWPVNGLMLAIMLRRPPSHWSWLALASMAGTAGAYFVTGAAPLLAALRGIFSTAELLLATHILYRSYHGTPDLTEQGVLVRFGLSAVVLAPLAAVVPGAWILCQITGASFLELARVWYLADALGLAVFGPLALNAQPAALWALLGGADRWRTLGLFVLLAACTSLALYQSHFPLLYVIYPPLLLVVFRLGMPGVVIGVFIITLLTIVFTAAGRGTFMLIAKGDWTQRVLLIQVFIATTLATMLPVSAVLTQRRRLMDALRRSEERLLVLSVSDPLTGLANRRNFDHALESALARANRNAQPLSLLMIDVDHFKEFNDRYGHLCGDACLKAVAHAVARHAHRPDDLAARFGGEEFAVILADTDNDGAAAIAERIRTLIKDEPLTYAGVASSRVSVSVGVATTPTHGSIDADGLIQAADRALYEAKRTGRDRVCTSAGDNAPPGAATSIR